MREKYKQMSLRGMFENNKLELLLQRIFHYTEDSQLLNTLRFRDPRIKSVYRFYKAIKTQYIAPFPEI